jgi:hypothetical protein
MNARFAHPRGVLAELLDMNPQEIPDRWLRDREIFTLLTEYYSPSLSVLRELESPVPGVIPRLNAVGTTRDKDEYADLVRARITALEQKEQAKKNGLFALIKRLLHRQG